MRQTSTAIRRLIAVAAICAVRPAWGAFTPLDSHATSARLAGLGGAHEGLPADASAALANPASFAQGEDATLSLSGGNGARYADWVDAAWFSLPVQDDLTLGIAYEGVSGGLGPGFAEHALGLSAGIAAAPHLALGVRGWGLQAATGPGLLSSGQGFSLDVGARSDWSFGSKDMLHLGVSGENVASEWPDRFWRRSVPISTRFGIGWSRRGLAWTGVQYDLAEGSSVATGAGRALRVGLESLAFKRFQVRGGYSTRKDQAYTGGISVPFAVWRIKAQAHYALVADEKVEELRHRLQLDMGLRVRRRTEIYAVPLQVVFEPGTKRIKSARISLNVEAAGEPAQEWELEIRDKNGNIIRVLRGTGVPPAFVTWDGKDALGESVEDGDQVSYRLNIRTASGLRSSKDAYATEAALNFDGLSELAIPMGDGALVVPVMGEDGQASQLLLKPPAMPGETQRWEILIQDENGNTLKKIEGSGALPKEMLWDGTDENGNRIANLSGIRVTFNAIDAEGHLNSIDQGLDLGLNAIEGEEDEGPRPDLVLRMPAILKGGQTLEMNLSDSTLKPLPVPTETPIPTPLATKVPVKLPEPTAVPTSVPSPPPTVEATPEPTAAPTSVETPRPSRAPSDGEIRPLLSGLQSGRYLDDPDSLPPAIMTRAEAAARGPQRPRVSRPSSGQKSTLRASVAGVMDVFKPDSAEVDEAKYGDSLQAFYWRLQSYRLRRIQLTGLVKAGETGGESLSRERVREFSRRMIEEGGFEGEFILKVNPDAQGQGGVRVEILSR